MPDTPGVTIVKSGKADIDPDNIERAIEATFPIFDNPRMGDYLSYRSCGFTFRESCSMAGVTTSVVRIWRKKNEQFARWEDEWLPHLRTDLAAIVTKAQWYRNLLWGMLLDGKVLKKAALARSTLTEFEQKYLPTARKQYDPQGLLALERATAPEGPGKDGDTYNIDQAVFVDADGKAIASEEGKRVASRALLEKFKSNEKYREHPEVLENEPEAIEGEVVGGNGSPD